MRRRTLLLAAGLTIALVGSWPAVPTRAAAGPAVADADAAFKRGEFDRAKALYADALRGDSMDLAAEAGLARMELYENDLDGAVRHAAHVATADTKNVLAQRVLATALERKRIQGQAAAIFTPPAPPPPPNQVVIPFLRSEPLPLVQLRVDGHEANLILDTGGPDIVLDPDFAREIGLSITGGTTGTFAGGRTAEVREAKVGRIEAGAYVIPELTVAILPARGMLPYKGVRVDGVLGTAFLSRFLSTIDYPHNRLVLDRPVLLNPKAGTSVARMWLVGDHYVFARGSVNTLENQLFMIDSGLAGGGFGAEAATVEAAHIRTMPEKASTGVGGGGAVRFIPAVADRLCVATACQRDVPAIYTPEGSPLAAFPFHAAGMVSDRFLRHYAVTFDFTAMQLILAPG